MTEACPFFVFGAVGPFMWRKGRLQRPWCGGVSLDSARGGAEVLALSWIQDLSGVHGGGAISLAGSDGQVTFGFVIFNMHTADDASFVL